MSKKSVVIFLLALALVSLGTRWAATQLRMTPEKANPNAAGTISLSKNSLDITAAGLKPRSVYTVWLVKTTPEKTEAGAGSPPYMFKTDSQGKGTYRASLAESPFGKWQEVMVVLHPDGNPENMENMVEALTVKVPRAAG